MNKQKPEMGGMVAGCVIVAIRERWSSHLRLHFDEDAPSLSTRKHGAYESVGYFALKFWSRNSSQPA